MCVHYQWTEICEIQNKKNLTENKNDNFLSNSYLKQTK